MQLISNNASVVKPITQDPRNTETIAQAVGNLPATDATPRYRKVKQGSILNAISMIRTNGKGVTTDPITGKLTVTYGRLTVTFEAGMNVSMKNSTHKLLLAIRQELAENSANPHVMIPLSKYMQDRGIKDEKEARKQVNADLDALFSAKATFEEKIKGAWKNFIDMRIISSKGIQNGIIHVTFATDFFDIVKAYPVMWIPVLTLMVDDKRNPNTLALIDRICAHRFMNGGKPNENIIPVKALFAVGQFPSLEDIKKTGQHVSQQIITPFERDMDAISEITGFGWYLCHADGTPLTEDELQDLSSTIEKFYVSFSLTDYPAEEQQKRLAQRVAQIEAVKKRMPRTKKLKAGIEA